MDDVRLFLKFASNGNINILENMKIVLYKENPVLFELVDFDNDRIFNELLLFAYFYEKNGKVTLEQILYGHIRESKRPVSINAWVDDSGLIYLPEIGWLKTDLTKQEVAITKRENESHLSLSFNGKELSFEFEPLTKIEGTSFELIPHQHPLLIPHFFDSNNRLVEVEIEHIAQVQKSNLTKAFTLIKNSVPEFYQ